jgi:hypothetical protein
MISIVVAFFTFCIAFTKSDTAIGQLSGILDVLLGILIILTIIALKDNKHIHKYYNKSNNNVKAEEAPISKKEKLFDYFS